MSNVTMLRAKPNPEPELQVRLQTNDLLDSDIPFLDFATDTVKINDAEGVMLYTVIKQKPLLDTIYMRDSILTDDCCPYMLNRPALLDLSKRRIALAPTLERHLRHRKEILLIDQVMIPDPYDDAEGYVATLKAVQRLYARDRLVIMLDWHDMMQHMSDPVLPNPTHLAERAGYINTGVFWISKV